MSRKSSNVGAAMLQPGRQSQAAGNISVMPAAEMPMVLTLDQLSPNPDNPRTSRNPRYDDIKASIRSRGLDTVPKVTRDPDGEPDMYIFSDGGNTLSDPVRTVAGNRRRPVFPRPCVVQAVAGTAAVCYWPSGRE
jgi:hypothetical protein